MFQKKAVQLGTSSQLLAFWPRNKANNKRGKEEKTKVEKIRLRKAIR